jgi:hypothetical protein
VEVQNVPGILWRSRLTPFPVLAGTIGEIAL